MKSRRYDQKARHVQFQTIQRQLKVAEVAQFSNFLFNYSENLIFSNQSNPKSNQIQQKKDLSVQSSGLINSVGALRSKSIGNQPDDIFKVTEKLSILGYLSDKIPKINEKDIGFKKKLAGIIQAIKSFQINHHLKATGVIKPNDETDLLLSSSKIRIENTKVRISDNITSIFEGGRYSTLSYGAKSDKQGISYGKHQTTLNSGGLGKLLSVYSELFPRNPYVIKLNEGGFLERVKKSDMSLQYEKDFINLLRESGSSDPEMKIAQDTFFDSDYGGRARKKMIEVGGISTNLGYAMFYDATIHGGLRHDIEAAEKKLGGKIGEKSKISSELIDENQFILSVAEHRQERNRRIGERKVKEGEKMLLEADSLEKSVADMVEDTERTKILKKARKLKNMAEKSITEGTANIISSENRLQFWIDQIKSKNFGLLGDENNFLTVKNGVSVVGINKTSG